METSQKHAWTAALSGGRPGKGSTTWTQNPQLAITPSDKDAFTITLQKDDAMPTSTPIAILVLRGRAAAPLAFGADYKVLRVANTNPQKDITSQTLTANLDKLADGEAYVVLPFTYERGQEGGFTLTVKSEAHAFTLAPLNGARSKGGKGAAGPTLATLYARGAVPPDASGADPVLSAAKATIRPGVPYTDAEFVCSKKDAAKVLYIGQPPAKAKTVDNWLRLGALGGSGQIAKAASPITPRDGVDDVFALCALAMVSTRADLLERIFPWSPEGSGAHAVRIFKDGDWRMVVVDDLLPGHGKSQLAYSSNASPGDGPVAIYLKALAKLYGNYEAISGGRVGGALEDMTGGFSEKIYLRDEVARLKQSPGLQPRQLWQQLKGLLDAGHLLGAGFKAKHAAADSEKPAVVEAATRSLVHPVLELREVQGLQMVRLSLQYASTAIKREYQGPWSNTSAEWQNSPAVAAELGGKPKDGSWWMPFDDFVAGFTKVYICRIPSPSTAISTAAGEWNRQTAGGGFSFWSSSRWRMNPQFRLKVSSSCVVLISVAQPDSELDGNFDSDSYPHAIGVYLFAASGEPRRKLHLSNSDLTVGSRFAMSRQVFLELELEAGTEYVLLPCTREPGIFSPFLLSVASPVPHTLEPLPLSGDWCERTLSAAWTAAAGTAGGLLEPVATGSAPNDAPSVTATWTQNPQFEITVSAPCKLVGVLNQQLSMSKHEHAEVSALWSEFMQLSATEADGEGDDPAVKARIAELDAQMAVRAPAIYFFLLRGGGGATGSYEEEMKRQIGQGNSLRVLSAAAEIDIPEAGAYTLIACSEKAGDEGNFLLSLYCTDETLTTRPLKGGTVTVGSEADVKGGRAQGPMGPKKDGGLAPPKAKHDVSKLREELGDDGKLGAGQRAELEEAARLEKWIENVPMLTIEGQPLSDNAKKRKADLIAYALAKAQSHPLGLYEDSETTELTGIGFPAATGDARGTTQPAIFNSGTRSNDSVIPTVTQWRRPSDIFEKPTLFRDDFDVEGVIQGALDNKWLLSAINIVAGKREVLDRVFMDAEHTDKGFVIVKIYHDDPYSDDDWQVIIVDDRIPCDASGQPVFARAADPNSYWVMLLEKAFAKYAGTYEALEGGTVTQGLEDLTGGIGFKFDLEKDDPLQGGAKQWIPRGEEPERLWDEIIEKSSQNVVAGCSCQTKGDPRPQTTKKGIELNRSYAIVTVGDFEDNKLMRMRIPLDQDGTAREWTGKWSDNSSAWTSRLRQFMFFSKKSDDGTFWIEYNDFCKHYNKVYMCRMLDDLWTRHTVKSRWMDRTAGGCTNFISWRHNNQWLLNISRDKTKLLIKLTQPDARKNAGHGRHYSNAIGFYILKGNEQPHDYKRRKLVLKDGDEEDGGDFVFVKEPRFSRQIIAEYTFEKASPTPYVIIPYLFEPGRESLFKMSILSDDRDDDGKPDFEFNEVKPEEDWKSTELLDAWSNGGAGNPLGEAASAGGPPTDEAGDELPWHSNAQFQIKLTRPSRCFVFLELRDIDHDMRDVEGLQTEPDYPTVGVKVYEGRGDHVKLDGPEPPKLLQVAEPRRGDGTWIELGQLDPSDRMYVVVPYTDKPGVEHKYVVTLYTDNEHKFEKINPSLNAADCIVCKNPTGLARVLDKLGGLEKKYALLMRKQAELRAMGVNPGSSAKAAGFGSAPLRPHGAAEGGRNYTQSEMDAYASEVTAHAEQQHIKYVESLSRAIGENDRLRKQLERLGISVAHENKGSRACSLM